MKVIGTETCLSDRLLNPLKNLGCNGGKKQFRIICGCKSRADANRQCDALGLRNNTFHPDYTSETADEEELRVAGQGGLFVKYPTKDGNKWAAMVDLLNNKG